jgi:hypothetical protein
LHGDLQNRKARKFDPTHVSQMNPYLA